MGFNEREYYREDGRGGFRLAIPRTVVVNLIVINVALFFLAWFTSQDSNALTSSLTAWLDLSPVILRQPWQVWRFLTYGFVHANVWHLIFNMYGLFLFGRDVEGRYGFREFLRVYLATIVFGGLVWLVTAYGVQLVTGRPIAASAGVVGASGGVIGVTILFCLNFPKRELLLMGILPVQAWMLGLAYVGIDVARAVSAGFGGSGKVAFQVHLAGALFAAAYFWMNWNFGFLSIGSSGNMRRWLQRKPRLKVLSASDDERPPARPIARASSGGDDLDRRADEVLRKLHESGEESLTAKERRVLEEYSRRMRQKHR